MRYFYDCPIEAAYMAKHFSMKFYDGGDPYYHGLFLRDDKYTWLHQGGVPGMARSMTTLLEIEWDHVDKEWAEDAKFFVHPNSIGILELQVGDWFSASDTVNERFVIDKIRHEKMLLSLKRGIFGNTKVIRRIGNHFFWPKEES